MGGSIFQLQIVRAGAALAVVVFHAQGELRHRGLGDPFPNLTVGAFGVDLFFVVSGFIMVVASERLFGQPGAAMLFMARRIARVAPLYWLFTALFALVALRLSYLPGHPPASITHVIASFLFLPALRPEDGVYLPTYSLGWTLNYEMFFYACFAAAIGLRRSRAVLCISVGLVGLVLIGRAIALPWPLFYWADPIVLEFVFGLWLGLAQRAGWRLPVPVGTPLALAALAFCLSCAEVPADWRGLVWGVPAVVLVAWSLGIRSAGTSLPARAATRLGDASFSLYLVHSALFIAVFYVLSAVLDPRHIPPAAYAGLLVLASVGAAIALSRWIEAPMTRRLQGLVRSRTRRDGDPAWVGSADLRPEG